MTTATFTFSYGIGTSFTPGSTIVIGSAAQTVNATLNDLSTPPDTEVIDGESLQYVTATVNTTVTYVGQTAAGDPVILAGSNYFVLSNDGGLAGSTTTNTTAYTLCFAAGTLISTLTGDARVEDLEIGTLVITADGRTVPVKWIGRQTVVAAFAGERARPVRVAAGALGDGLPHTDLVLTADHALILDGLAINAGALVNGTTITRDPAPERATYYHVETEAHDAILANGVAAESFVDYVGRRAFDNHAEYVALYGEDLTIAEMPLPRVTSARHVPAALRTRLAARAVA